MPKRVLIVESDIHASHVLTRFFEDRGDEIWHAWKLDEGAALLDLVRPDLMMMDIHFPGDIWLSFLSRTREKYPDLQIIMTTKQIDLQRELLAKQRGVEVFVRHPFTPHWLEQSIESVEGRFHSNIHKTSEVNHVPPVYLSMRAKIILPFMILAFIFGVLGSFIYFQTAKEMSRSYQDGQLTRIGIQTGNWMVDNETSMLATLRQLANTQGMTEALLKRDSTQLSEIIKPVMANNGEDAVEVLDLNGNGFFSLHRSGEVFELTSSDSFFVKQHAVQMALSGMADRQGDKYALLVDVPWGHHFYLCGPLYGENNQPLGVILVGRSLSSLMTKLSHSLLVEVSFYNPEGKLLTSTFQPDSAANLPEEKVQQVLRDQQQAAFSRQMLIHNQINNELFLPWNVRYSQNIGVIGVTIPASPALDISLLLRVEIVIAVILLLGLVWLVGSHVAFFFTSPIKRLITATLEVNRGNLVTKVEANGRDEISVLIHSFNAMLVGFQQSLIYRDLMGYAPSFDARQSIQASFENETADLRGYEADVTVLVSDVHGFTAEAQKLEPQTAVEILNDYFERLTSIVVAHNGVINKLEGDAMLVIFGALPQALSPQESALRACQAALTMRQSIEAFNRKNVQMGLPELITGIGIHTGKVVLGCLFIHDQLHYTPIGSSVKITHCLEQLARQTSTENEILISQETYEILDDYQEACGATCIGSYDLNHSGQKTSVYRLSPLENEEEDL